MDGKTKSVFDWAVWWIGRWKPGVGNPPPDSVIRKTIRLFRRRAKNHGWQKAVLTPPEIPMTEPEDDAVVVVASRYRSLGEIRAILAQEPWPPEMLPQWPVVAQIVQQLQI